MDNARNSNDGELSVKDLILKLKELWAVLWSNKIKIIASGLLLAILFSLSTIGSKKHYNAELSFMLNEDDGSDFALTGMLGQFGFNNVRGESNFEKILELSKTRKIVQEAVLDKITINGKEDYLANHIINNQDSLGLWQAKKWYKLSSSNPKLDIKDFRFSTDSLEAFTPKDNKALKAVHKLIVGGDGSPGILKSGFDEGSGIMLMEANTSEGELSVNLLNKLFTTLSGYYVDKSVEKQKSTYDIVKEKADSIYGALSTSEAQLAGFLDANRGLFSNKDRLKEARLKREIQKLTVMYTEAAKNKEVAEFSLQNKTPYIQLIDEPLLPIKGRKKSLIKYFILGGILGAFLASLYFLSGKIYKDIMA